MKKDKLEKLFNVEVEESVLSSYLMDNESFFNFESKAKFFSGHRVDVFNAILDLLKNGFDADIVSVCSKLSGIVKASFVSDIMEKPVSFNLEYHIKTLQNCAALRDLHMAYTKGLEFCEDGLQPTDILSNVGTMIDIHGEDKYQRQIKDIALEVSTDLDSMGKNKGAPGYKTGLPLLDWNMGGLRDQELIIVAARPGHGKTVFAMNTARNLGFSGVPGIVFSLEMPQKTLIKRMLCDIGGISGNAIFRNEIQDHHWPIINETMGKISEFRIDINDRPNQSIDTIYIAAKKAKITNGIRFIIVDYLQLISGWNKEGQGPKSEITRQLKMMAKDLNLPVMVLSQLNREIEKRVVKIPKMSDLRDAGSIEQDADVILFTNVEHEQGTASIFIAKNREGRTGEIQGIKWEGEYFRFSQSHRGY